MTRRRRFDIARLTRDGLVLRGWHETRPGFSMERRRRLLYGGFRSEVACLWGRVATGPMRRAFASMAIEVKTAGEVFDDLGRAVAGLRREPARDWWRRSSVRDAHPADRWKRSRGKRR